MKSEKTKDCFNFFCRLYRLISLQKTLLCQEKLSNYKTNVLEKFLLFLIIFFNATVYFYAVTYQKFLKGWAVGARKQSIMLSGKFI